MILKLKYLISNGRYEEALQECQNAGENLDNLITELAYEMLDVSVYSFICYQLMKNETSDLHVLAATVLIGPLSLLEGAYASSLFHVRRAIELDSADVLIKELLLLLNLVPDKVVEDEEAKKVAGEILHHDPENKAALDFIKICARKC
ncbi:conserved hypothetical protein [Paenibacillus curdlanolyticus YK9]|uniref:Immunity protein 30 domain-containing protein n=1 Tax=Paenibacillus curdlanolyticus YK9 TaxID=717606 RepID=E0IFC3_9BACL|nr:hypothetical protein [Paenibacillus curdlanolyticus]EFM08899.1 conserved hypothetical protein [Paenibacillus curdlanolyticus YK9]